MTGRAAAPLGSPAFRRYLAGQLPSVTGSWAQVVALSWVIVSLDRRALGWVIALQFLPSLALGPWFGAITDRHDRRRLLIAAESGLGLVALTYALASAAGVLTMPLIYPLAAVWGRRRHRRVRRERGVVRRRRRRAPHDPPRRLAPGQAGTPPGPRRPVLRSAHPGPAGTAARARRDRDTRVHHPGIRAGAHPRVLRRRPITDRRGRHRSHRGQPGRDVINAARGMPGPRTLGLTAAILAGSMTATATAPAAPAALAGLAGIGLGWSVFLGTVTRRLAVRRPADARPRHVPIRGRPARRHLRRRLDRRLAGIINRAAGALPDRCRRGCRSYHDHQDEAPPAPRRPATARIEEGLHLTQRHGAPRQRRESAARRRPGSHVSSGAQPEPGQSPAVQQLPRGTDLVSAEPLVGSRETS